MISLVQVQWTPPPKLWIKINTDRSILSNTMEASCGGIIRNHEGKFLAAWSVNLGSCTITMAELWGIFWGLFISYNMGHRNVILETDSTCVYHLVMYGVPETHTYSSLVYAVRNLIRKDWNVEINHSFREANRYANSLAKYGHRIPIGISFFDRAPTSIFLDLLVDSSGHSCTRIVCCSSFWA